MKQIISILTFLATVSILVATATSVSMAASTTAASTDEGPVRLRVQSTVDGDVVTLGDLFTGIGELADQEVGPAPEPGRSATYKADHLSAIARAHNVDWRPASAVSRTVIRRGGETVGEDEIVELLRREFRQQGAVGRIKIRLNRMRNNILRPTTGNNLQIDDLTFESDGGPFSAYIKGDISERETQQEMLRGRVDFVARVPVPNRGIRKGQIISRSDIKLSELSLRKLGSDTIESIDLIVGQAAKRNLRQNQSIRASDLRAPIIIPKGTMVTVSLKTNGLSLSGTGRALEDGSQGEVIRILNLQSKRTVEANVVGPSHVLVALRRQLAVVVNK
ncbi:MAG: flagellar basal body P-ring formation protein FlgA [Rhodospirillaceae bacterium]|jgi:flagella basal body P-ring formation protein FlgA|nr:flagellar basal body P-ring formation protein FlgA [Rhodospirillaceae bacterium]MBT5080003.1 flagellar basal body P-ring formation protein FlgA [Rhodospirillaceae bacterium]MBT6218947.1 flagellar basal body P-ring formation protein FlgA [Rhodospirillaceae bacterium]MBT7146608.1 flagellar basal body P-ring formation protein FlgA [Rhodospirillales bacterium]